MYLLGLLTRRWQLLLFMELTRLCPTNKKGHTIYSWEGKYSPFHCTNKMSGNHSIMAGCCLSNRTEENGPLNHEWRDGIGVIQTVDLQKNKSGWYGKIYKPLLSLVMKSQQRKQSFRWHAAIILENESVLCRNANGRGQQRRRWWSLAETEARNASYAKRRGRLFSLSSGASSAHSSTFITFDHPAPPPPVVLPSYCCRLKTSVFGVLVVVIVPKMENSNLHFNSFKSALPLTARDRS